MGRNNAVGCLWGLRRIPTLPLTCSYDQMYAKLIVLRAHIPVPLQFRAGMLPYIYVNSTTRLDEWVKINMCLDVWRTV